MSLMEVEGSRFDTNHDCRSRKYQSNTSYAIQRFRKGQSIVSQAERGEDLCTRADSSSLGTEYSMSTATNGRKLGPCCDLSSIDKGSLTLKSLKNILRQ